MPFGTANNKLRKNILFYLLVKYNENICFQCGELIDSVDQLSIEHKISWLDKDVRLFWDLDNIAFSHLSCNIIAANKERIWKPESLIKRSDTMTKKCSIGENWCSHCGCKPVQNFSRNKHNTRGFETLCKTCRKLYRK